MLSEDALNKLAQPIIDRQNEINNYFINEIAKKVKEIGMLSPSDVKQLQRILEYGGDVRRINAQIAKLSGVQETQIKQIIKYAAMDGYADVKQFYDYRNLSYIPFEENEDLQRVVTAIAKETVGTYKNLSNARAFLIQDPKNPTQLKPTSLAKTYQQTIDKAVQALRSGVIDYNMAMRKSMEDLIDSGMKTVEYTTDEGKVHYQRLDTAVRRNILDGLRAINQGVQDETGKEFGADGVEISVHAYPAEDHAPVQGHQFTNEEYDKMQNGEDFEDVDGEKFEGFPRAIGTWNCHHFAFSIVVGDTRTTYTKEQLKKIQDKNNKGYTMPNGKHLTMYQCREYQRQLETKVRYAKDGQIAARNSGDDELAEKYQWKVNKYTSQYKAFSKACGLNIYNELLTVKGYTKMSLK
jgi:hypothetical protein